MKKLTTIAVLLSLSACGLPQTAAIPASFVAAPAADRAVNLVAGGTPGYTISAQTGQYRNEGSKPAAFLCAVYGLGLGWYDLFYFGQEAHAVFEARKADHCEKMRLLDSGELEGLKRPLPLVKPPMGAKNGLRIVR